MLLYSQKYSADFPAPINPTDEIAGFEVRPGLLFEVRPGLFDVNGAMALASGVNFTVHTREDTGCELLLKEPRIDGSYMMNPRTVAVFTGRVY